MTDVVIIREPEHPGETRVVIGGERRREAVEGDEPGTVIVREPG